MSLRRKIIGWFVVFAALTVIVFGLGDHIQSTRALRFALQTRAGSLALQVASDAERRYERAEAELRSLAYAAAAGGLTAVPAPQNQYRQLQVARAGVVVFEADAFGTEQPAAPGCGDGDVVFDVTVHTAAGTPYTVVARMPAEHFFAGVASISARLGRHGTTAVMSTADGRVVFDPGCATRSDSAAGGLTASMGGRVVSDGATDPGTVLIADLTSPQTRDLVLATVRTVTPPGWTAVASVDYEEFAAPFTKARWQYFGAMVLTLLGALLLIVGGLRRDMRRLTAISHAADAIGHGRFDVWLPPPTGDEIGRVSLALGRMTERLSSSLRQIEVSRSMAAVGELSTYLSHEIRNPLSSIRLNLQMLRRDLRGGEVPEDGALLVGLCLSELERLDDVVRTVLEVGRSGRGAAGTCAADQVVEETLRVIRRKVADQGVELNAELNADHFMVTMRSSALRGIVLNLLLNAVDALAGRPQARITVTTRLLDEDEGEARFELRVADNGPGVPAHLRERIFDPFFTTKPTGNGVGLPTALQAVQECGGILRCEPSSDWGPGAEFVVELPLAGTPAVAEAASLPEFEFAVAGAA